MNISGVAYPTVNSYSIQDQQTIEMQLSSSLTSEREEAHEERKEEIDAINAQSLS